MSRQLVAGLVIVFGVFVVVPAAWGITSVGVLAGAWALHDLAGLQLSFLKANVAGPVGILCGMGAAFLAALACGLVARGILNRP